MNSKMTKVNNSVLARLVVAEYLNRQASSASLTVDGWLCSVRSTDADKFNIIDEYDVEDTQLDIGFSLERDINREYDRLYDAAIKLQRKHVKVLEGKTIVFIAQDSQDSEGLFFIGVGGEILCKVAAGTLYDKDGFHFDTNDLIEHTR